MVESISFFLKSDLSWQETVIGQWCWICCGVGLCFTGFQSI